MATEFKFTSLYKALSTHSNQEERRKEILEKQKQQRSAAQDNARRISNYIHSVRGESRSKKNTRRQNKEHKLQLSEWLKGRPEDLERWFLVPCPKGQRCVVIATDGRTEVYNKRGSYMFSFRSYIPGSATDLSHSTVLDCIYVEKASIFYVLDAMAYSNIDLVLCEAQFRFFWIQSKLEERPELSEMTEANEMRFIPLKFYDFEDQESVSRCLLRYPQFEEDSLHLDGFLFYHKDSSYVQGHSPLVGWLFPFMVTEILHLDVHPEYMSEKPMDYVDCFSYMVKFDKSLSEKKKQRRRKREDVGDCEENMVVELAEAERALEIYGERLDDDPFDDELHERVE